MMAGLRRGAGAVLWIAVPPGERGYERFPYLLEALCRSRLGAALPLLPPVGLLRFRLPLARRPGLLRGPLAARGDLRAARRRLALL